MTSTASDSVTVPSVMELCEKLDTAKSLAVYICLKWDHNALFQLDVHPRDYANAECFAIDYGIVNLLKKFKGLATSFDKRALALEAWMSSEDQCRQTNIRFRTGASPLIGTLASVLHGAQLKIASILGPLDVAACLERGHWGDGATYDVSRRGSIDGKYSNTVTVTPGCLVYGRIVLSHDPLWFESITGLRPEGPYTCLDNCFNIVAGNRFATVPKTSKIDRCIAIEPTMNGFIQLGAGDYIRDRLRKVGINLNSQELNQSLAAKAAVEGLATLDLSAASDTIARELVMSLLPLDWAMFLDALRSRSTQVDGNWVHLSKFSSMGNGFTFELETLIFYSLCYAASSVARVGGTVAAFGDDLIVPQESAPLVIETLVACGFTLNTSKSFTSGVFFESCGRHYFDGRLVTPPYQKSLVNSSAELIRFANRLVRWSIRVRGAWGRDRAVAAVRRSVIRHYRETNGNHGPVPAIPFGTPGDGGFLYPHAHFDRFDRSHGVFCHVLVWKDEVRALRDLPIYACKIRFPEKQYRTGTVERRRPRGGVSRDVRNVIPRGSGCYVLSTRWVNFHDLTDEDSLPRELRVPFGLPDEFLVGQRFGPWLDYRCHLGEDT